MSEVATARRGMVARLIAALLGWAILLASLGSIFLLTLASNLGTHAAPLLGLASELWPVGGSLVLSAGGLYLAITGPVGRAALCLAAAAALLASFWCALLA